MQDVWQEEGGDGSPSGVCTTAPPRRRSPSSRLVALGEAATSRLWLLGVILAFPGCAPPGPQVDHFSFPAELGSAPLTVVGEYVVHGTSVISLREQEVVASLPVEPGRQHVAHVSGDRLYLGAYDTVWVLDMADPRAPALLGTKGWDELFRRSITDISGGDDGILWVTTGARVVRMDVSDPANIVTLSMHNIEGETFQVIGDVAYSASGYGPGVWDLSSGEPVLVGRPIEDRSGGAAAVHVHARDGYLAATFDGEFYLFSLEDPLHPQPHAHLTVPPRNGIVGFGVAAYVQVWNERYTFVRHFDFAMTVVNTAEGTLVESHEVGAPGPALPMNSSRRFMVFNSGNYLHVLERLD